MPENVLRRLRAWLKRAKGAPSLIEQVADVQGDQVRDVHAVGTQVAALTDRVAVLEQALFGELERMQEVSAEQAELGLTATLGIEREAGMRRLLGTVGEQRGLRPGLSVLTISWNHAGFLRAGVHSALATLDLLPPDEQGAVLVLDDDSSDETPQVLEDLRAADGRVHPVRSPVNLGLTRARNVLLHVTETTHALMLDADNSAVPEGAAALYQIAREWNSAFTYGNVLMVAPDRSKFAVMSNEPLTTDYFFAGGPHIDTLGVLDVAYFRQIGGYSPYPAFHTWGDDHEIIHRLARLGALIAFVPTVAARYRLDPLSHSQVRQGSFEHAVGRLRRAYNQDGELTARQPTAMAAHPVTGPLWATPAASAARPELARLLDRPVRSPTMSQSFRTDIQTELVPAPPELESEDLDRGDELWARGRIDEALAAYEAGVEKGGQTHLFHKRIAGLFESTRGLDAAFHYYGLGRLDDRAMSIGPGEIICGLTVRNEADLLPYFLEYHERLGVDRFLVVDNLSEDESRDILLAHPKVHLWQTAMSHYLSNTGNAWLEVLFRAFARDHWCLVIDADELFYYPGVETRSPQKLCDQHDQAGKVAVPAVLLDMYSDRPIRDVAYRPGQDPLELCPFFDREFFHWRGTAGPWQNFEGFAGGVRRRAFGDDSYPFLGKVPLFRYTADRVIPGGVHSTNAPSEKIASERGALLHFKFMARFIDRLEEEGASERRSRDSSESYATYERALSSNPDMCLYDPTVSTRLRDSRQLVELGIMSDGVSMTQTHGQNPDLPTVDEYVAQMHEFVPGWFDDVDAAVFRAIDRVHRACGVEGDVLEIGAYLGKSAILLGYLLRPHEHLVVCDLFTHDNLDSDLDPDAELYGELSRRAFDENYARYHRRPATVIERSSTQLMDEGLDRSFRIVHIDGSHRYDIVSQDIATALDLVVDGGIVVVDDYRTVPHALGVAAAVWEAVSAGKLIPVLATVQKLYGCAAGDSEATASMLRRWAFEDAPFGGVRQQVAGREIAVFAPPMGLPTLVESGPSPEAEEPLTAPEEEAEVARLRERLALIEGSRTWRVRNWLMRFIRRGRTSDADAPE